MGITDRFQMTQEDNILCAKRLLIDSIYSQANLEGIAVTYAQTNDILNNVGVGELTPLDINKICCLRDGWRYVLDNINESVDLGYLQYIHEIVARFDVPYHLLGKIRTSEVLISGTQWRPEMPNVEKLHQELMDLKQISCVTERALTIGLWVMRNQLFMDGNKRVGCFVANKILIENGKGIMNVPVELDSTFKRKLVLYYETNEPKDILKWICDNCMQGINEIQMETSKSQHEKTNLIIRKGR